MKWSKSRRSCARVPAGALCCVHVTFQKCASGTNTSCAHTQGERLLDAAGGASKVCGGLGVYGDDACSRLLARSTLDCSLASSIEYQAMAGARQPRQQKKRCSHETSFYMLICFIRILPHIRQPPPKFRVKY